MAITVQLSKPISVGEDTIDFLELREPTVEDVGDIGYPFLMHMSDNSTALELRPKIVLKYISRLSSYPPSTIKKISMSDLSELNGVVMGFFGGEEETPKTSSTALLK